MTPRTPIARARVRASASTREPITRIVPASPTSSEVERSRPLALVAPLAAERQPAARRVAERLDAEQRPALGPDPDPDARADVADDAGQRALDRLGMLAGGQRPVAAVLVQQLAGLGRRPAPQPRPGLAGRRPAVAGPRPSSAVAARASSTTPRVAEPFGDRRPGDDRVAGRRRAPDRPGASGNRTSIGPARSGRRPTRSRPVERPRQRLDRRLAGVASRSGRARGGHRSRVSQRRLLPRLEQLAPAVHPLGQPEGHVAQVDEQAAEPAGDVDREAPAARPEPDRVAEVELGGRDLARRQVDELEAARDEVGLARPGAGVDGQAAGARARPGSRPG